MFRTPDSDPLMVVAMRRVRSLRVEDADTDERYQGGRWEKTGCKPKSTLCGGVKQGGRYLGAIELVNPMGGGPFHDSEINALDYICEQFAEFLANRPIVLEADVVMPKS
jgi:GAF domain-containing protein